jgi:hypothetical protein
MVKTASFKRLILRAVLRQVSPMVIRLFSVCDHMPLPEFTCSALSSCGTVIWATSFVCTVRSSTAQQLSAEDAVESTARVQAAPTGKVPLRLRHPGLDPRLFGALLLAARPNPPTQAEQALMLQAEDVATAGLFAAGLPPRATVSDMTIVPTDNQAWRSYAHAIAKG